MVSYFHSPLQITLDSGATVSYIKLENALRLNLEIKPNNQLALLADQQTRMASLGEVDFNVTLNKIQMRVRALVMRRLQAECFGGTTFHADNGIEANIKSGTISIHGKYVVMQFNPSYEVPLHPPDQQVLDSPLGCSVQDISLTKICEPPPSHPSGCEQRALLGPPSPLCHSSLYHTIPTSHDLLIRAISLPIESMVLPSDYLNIPVPKEVSASYLSITPSFPSAIDSPLWPPQICEVINGSALYRNYSKQPLIAPKFSHFKPNRVSISELADHSAPEISKCSTLSLSSSEVQVSSPPKANIDDLLSLIAINESILSKNQLARLREINKSFCQVFDNNLQMGYNHHAGRFYADFTFSNKPPPTRVFVPQYNKKCSDIQQAKCDELEEQGVLVDPKKFDISVLHVSPSWIQQKGRAKHKKLQECTLDELRFITAFNSLNDCIRPKPSTSCSATTIFMFLSRWRYHIFADLNNSYFQLPVKKSLWCYLGIMTPYKGIRVLTRTGQGLLGSDVELEQLLCRVLGPDISQGHCVAIRDDIVIGGNSIEEAIINYQSVLRKLHENNLKLSPNKVRIFPEDTEIYGYRIKNNCILPSEHTVLSLGKSNIEDLKTNKQVNSWKGLYKTLIGHLPALSNLMSPFDAATAGKNSNESFTWTPALTSAFNEAMRHLGNINKTYLPQPSEQLILLPDAMSTTPCVGWVLYVKREGKMLPVVFCTAKLKDYMSRWYPCEKEAVGVVLSLDQCSHWIAESLLPTLVGPDSLAVVKASELMRKGKHSSNPRLQSLLASVNRRNIRFFHNSAKAGNHIVPDHLSRLKDTTCNAKDCAVERFLHDVPNSVEAMTISGEDSLLTLSSLLVENGIPAPPILAATALDIADELINRSGPIPLGSHHTWKEIQKSDQDCQAVYKLKKLGEAPRKKNTNPIINKIFKESVISRGLLVVKSFDSRKLREVMRVVVPSSYIDSILAVLHIRLNHPKRSQLKLVFERYFFSPRCDAALGTLYSSCHLCIGLQKFPKELETFRPSLQPEHPGLCMNIDIIKRAGQLILVCVDLFSFYTTSCFIPSEKAEDMEIAIIQAVTPIRRASSLSVRVDKAPGFMKLASTNRPSLSNVGIKLVIGDDENKNSNCSVDKAISELEEEIVKLSPDGSKIDVSTLAQATMQINSKIRNRGLTAEEVHFSRDSHNNENLVLNDEELNREQRLLRERNHPYLSRSRAPKGREQSTPALKQGDLVFMKSSGPKHTTRDPHVVIGKDQSNKILLRKAINTLHSAPGSTNLSHRTKRVDSKFLFKPTSFQRSEFMPLEEITVVDNDLDHQTTRIHPQWNPIPINSNEEPILLYSDRSLDMETSLNTSYETGSSCHFIADQPSQDEDLQDSTTSTQSSASSHENDTIFLNRDADDITNNPNILTFNDGESPNTPEQLLQDRRPKVGDHISFFDVNAGSWINAHIITDLNRRWRYYYNIMYDDGTKDGLYLKPDTRWTFLNWSNNEVEFPRSAETPSTTVDVTPQSPQNLTPNDPTIPPTHHLLELSEDIDNSRAESLEWDMLGTELVSETENVPLSPSQVVLDRVSSLDFVLPLPLGIVRSSSPVPLDAVSNLEAILPLVSSPVRSQPRVSRPRQPLPRETRRSRSFTPSFLRNLNWFRKRRKP